MGMSRVIELGSYFMACPVPWQNMILKLQTNPHVDVTVLAINSELAKFDAVYESEHLVFHTETGYLLWVLTWT